MIDKTSKHALKNNPSTMTANISLANTLPSTRPISWSVSSFRKKSIDISIQGATIGRKALNIRERGKRVHFPLQDVLDHALEMKPPPNGKFGVLYFCPNGDSDIDCYKIEDELNWKKCIRDWHRTHVHRIVEKMKEENQIALKTLDPTYGPDGKTLKEALINIPSEAFLKSKKINAIIQIHEIAEIAYHLPVPVFTSSIIQTLLGGIRSPDRSCGSCCSGALWAIITSSTAARWKCLIECPFGVDRILEQTLAWSKSVIHHTNGDKSGLDEAFKRIGFLCSCIMHDMTSALFLNHKLLIPTICSLMSVTHHAPLMLLLETVETIFYGSTVEKEELRDDFIDQGGMDIMVQNTLRKLDPNDSPTHTALVALTIIASFVSMKTSRLHLYKAREQLYDILETFLTSKETKHFISPLMHDFLERLGYICWGICTAICENVSLQGATASDLEFAVSMSQIVLSSSTCKVHEFPKCRLYILFCIIDLVSISQFARAVANVDDFVTESKDVAMGIKPELMETGDGVTENILREVHIIILSAMSRHSRESRLRETLLKLGIREALIALAKIAIDEPGQLNLDLFTVHLMTLAIGLLSDGGLGQLSREEDFRDANEVTQSFLFSTDDPIIQMNVILSMFNFMRQKNSPCIVVMATKEVIARIVSFVEYVHSESGHVTLTLAAEAIIEKFEDVTRDIVESLVWHSVCLLVLIAKLSKTASDILLSLNVLPRVLNCVFGLKGHETLGFIQADHHEDEKFDGQMRKLGFLFAWTMVNKDRRAMATILEHDVIKIVIVSINNQQSSPSLKMMGVDFLQALLVDISNTLEEPHAAPAIALKEHLAVEDIINLTKEMLLSPSGVLVCHGALSIARMAMWPKGARLCAGTVTTLANCLHSSCGHSDVQEAVLHALLNLSIEPTNQVKICKLLLKDLVWIALNGKMRREVSHVQIQHADEHEKHDSLVWTDSMRSRRYSSILHNSERRGGKMKLYASRCLSNLNKHKQNRTDFYKVELEMFTPASSKAADAVPGLGTSTVSDTVALDGTEITLPVDMRTKRRRDKKTDSIRGQFIDWLGDIRPESNNYPSNHSPRRSKENDTFGKSSNKQHLLSTVFAKHNHFLGQANSPLQLNLRRPISKIWKTSVVPVLDTLPLNWTDPSDGSSLWNSVSPQETKNEDVISSIFIPHPPNETMRIRTMIPLSTASRMSPRKRRWMPKVNSIHRIGHDEEDLEEGMNSGSHNDTVNLKTAETEKNNPSDSMPLKIQLQAHSPRHSYKFVPQNFFDHHIVAWRFSLVGFDEKDRHLFQQALSEHFQVPESDLNTRIDPRAGKSSFQDIHMSGGKGKGPSQRLSKEVEFFVKSRRDQQEFLDSYAALLTGSERPVPSNLKIYKPELPRIFSRPDESEEFSSVGIAPELKTRRLLKFNHVEGAKCYSNLFQKYRGPDGKSFFLYAHNTVFEAPVEHVLSPDIPTDDEHLDIIATVLSGHHLDPLADISVESRLPKKSPRVTFPELSCARASRRTCSTVESKNEDLTIVVDTDLADNSILYFRFALEVDPGAKEAPRTKDSRGESTQVEKNDKMKVKTKGGRKKHQKNS